MPDATESDDAPAVSSRLATGLNTVAEVLRYNFTQNGSHKHSDAFSKAALYWFLGFGFLSLLFIASQPYGAISLVIAAAGLLGSMALEVAAGISGSVYQRGLFGFIQTVGRIVFALAEGFVIGSKWLLKRLYLGLAGFLILSPAVMWVVQSAPNLFNPVAILVYLSLASGWALNGIMYADTQHPTESIAIPPVGLLQWIVTQLSLPR